MNYPEPHILRWYKNTWLSIRHGDLIYLIAKTPHNTDIEIAIIDTKNQKVLQPLSNTNEMIEMIRLTSDYENYSNEQVLIDYAEHEHI